MSAFYDIQQRNAELFGAFKKAMSQSGITFDQAVEAAINSPTSRYWVSPNYVYRDIKARLRGYATAYDPSARRKKVRSCKETMYDELWELYQKLSEKAYFKGSSTYFLVSFVVNQKAPRFYLSHRQGLSIIRKMLKENRSRMNINRDR